MPKCSASPPSSAVWRRSRRRGRVEAVRPGWPRSCRHRARPAGDNRRAAPLKDRPGRRGTQDRHPHGRTRHCPVIALDHWLSISGIDHGPVFRPVDRHARVAPERLSGEAVSLVVKERVAAAGIDASGFSGHSLRAGFATSATQAGVSTVKIRAQTGHASDAMLSRYVRDGEMFVGNAAGILL